MDLAYDTARRKKPPSENGRATRDTLFSTGNTGDLDTGPPVAPSQHRIIAQPSLTAPPFRRRLILTAASPPTR
jgi:hypothetical protein